LTRKVEARGTHDYKRKLAIIQAQVKKTQDMLAEKGSFNQHDFNWTPPNVSQETLSGLKTHIRHLCRKEAAMRKLLESVPEVSEDDKSKTEKFDEPGRVVESRRSVKRLRIVDFSGCFRALRRTRASRPGKKSWKGWV